MLRRGYFNGINVLLAANAYACNHLSTGLDAYAATAQGQQGGANQKHSVSGPQPCSAYAAMAACPALTTAPAAAAAKNSESQAGQAGIVRHGAFPGLYARLPAHPG